jgi:hypothetical protein
MKTLILIVFASLCAASAFATADDEPPAAREILRGVKEARGVSASTLHDYVTQIAVIEREMTNYDLNTRTFLLGLYYAAWLHVREVKGMEDDSTRFYDRFRNIQFELQLSDRQLAKLAHHHERQFAHNP